MLHRYRLSLATAPLAGLLAVFAGPAAAPAAAAPAATGPTTAVTYQIGISHDGYSGDTSIVPPLTHKWSDSFSGGVSYPLITGDKVFVTAANSSGNGYSTTLYALSKTTGKTTWSKPIIGTFPWSNAAYDAGQVFVVNFSGLLQAFSAATGTLNWSVQLSQYSFSSPPTASKGVVYVGGAGSGGTVYAVSETNGSILWTQGVQNGDHSSPALSATSVFVSYACGLVYSFNRTSGQQQWFSNGPCEGGGGKTSVVHGNKVYARDPIAGNKILNATTGKLLGTFQAGPAPAFDRQTGLYLYNGTLTASTGGKTAWSFAGDGGLDTAPIVVGSTVYAGSSSGMLYGLNVGTGAVVWSGNVGSPISGPDEQNVSQPLTGLGAGSGVLVVPAGDVLTAYGD